MQIIELVTFRIKPDLREEEFHAAVAETDEWLARQPGFIARRHGRSSDGSRVDVCEWETMEAAQAAAEKFPKDGACQRFMQALDMESISMRHFEIASSV